MYIIVPCIEKIGIRHNSKSNEVNCFQFFCFFFVLFKITPPYAFRVSNNSAKQQEPEARQKER